MICSNNKIIKNQIFDFLESIFLIFGQEDEQKYKALNDYVVTNHVKLVLINEKKTFLLIKKYNKYPLE